MLSGCHGSDDTTQSLTPPKATFTYTLTAVNLTVSFDSSGSISADGNAATSTWSFGDQVTSTTTAVTGTTASHTYAEPGVYDVTLTVTDDHGTSVTVVHTINVTGTPSTVLGVENWYWVGGNKYADSAGIYETEFTANAANLPSSRQYAATWYSGGKLWMFGGAGYDSTGTTGELNDLWNCTPTITDSGKAVATGTSTSVSACVWTWVGGSNQANQSGAYPSTGVGTFSATSLPGARSAAATWTDLNGNMWLFGGEGYDKSGSNGVMNDLWSFSVSGQAEWVAGPNVVDDQGNTTNPPSRAYAATWTDKYGNFWLFGGEGINSSGTVFYLNDLWCFTPDYVNKVSCGAEADVTSGPTAQPGTVVKTGTWTQLTGGTINGSGVYAAGSTSIPGARINPQPWVDGSGNFWMFGGSGYDSAGSDSSLSDVWMYSPTTKLWTYMYGSTTVGAAEVGPSQGVFASGNTPSARLGTVGWTDPNGTTLWLWGGSGTDSTGTSTSSDGGGALNELWAFDTTPGKLGWAFVAGSTTAGTAGVYPVPPMGTASIYAIPGSRIWTNMWLDAGHNVWMFGGSGDDVIGTSGYLNDLWMMDTTAMPHH